MAAKSIMLDVTILGRQYRVACKEPERAELLQAVAYLDARMGEIRDAGKVTGAERIAVMAALNIANELLRQRNAGPDGSAVVDELETADIRRRISDMQNAIDEVMASQEKLS